MKTRSANEGERGGRAYRRGRGCYCFHPPGLTHPPLSSYLRKKKGESGVSRERARERETNTARRRVVFSLMGCRRVSVPPASPSLSPLTGSTTRAPGAGGRPTGWPAGRRRRPWWGGARARAGGARDKRQRAPSPLMKRRVAQPLHKKTSTPPPPLLSSPLLTSRPPPQCAAPAPHPGQHPCPA